MTEGITGPRSPDRAHDLAVNSVQIRGRLSAAPEERALPSGDTVVMLRVVVPRVPGRRRGVRGRQATVDTIDCALWRADLRRRAVRWGPGDLVLVQGSLRRRFWRGQGQARSRYEVEVVAARREDRA
jgi:single-strand DNA-binding protein